jgi:peptidoglycan/LPS O-acetylase OafA/YrhL
LNPSNRHYYPALDGLRGIAILSVVGYHNFGMSIRYFSVGWLGLDIFFVLSGFLITDILMRSLGKPNFLQNFYRRRVLRIFPLYYLSLIVFLVILPRLPDLPVSLDYYVNNQVWLWTFLQNWLYIFHPPVTESALNHLWSLAVEEQFYLFWPLLVLLLKKPQRLLAVIATVLVAVILFRFIIWKQAVPDLSYYNLYTFSRIDGICIGCMVALLQRINATLLGKRTSLIVFSFAIFNFIFYLLNLRNNDAFPYLALVGFSTFAMLIGLLVYELVHARTPFLNKVFSIGLLRYFGKISFSLYIIHWPLYQFTHPALFRMYEKNFPTLDAELLSSITATLLGIALGTLSFYLAERPFFRKKFEFEVGSPVTNH